MKITGLSVFAVELPIRGGSYRISGGRTYSAIHSTLLAIETDAGITGWGESCPFGSNVTPGYALGVRSGLQELAPSLIGQDPTQVEVVNRHMDLTLTGHSYVKSAVDMACMDIAAKKNDQPLYRFLGGKFGGEPLTHAIVHGPDADALIEKVRTHRVDGYRIFKLKLTGDTDKDIEILKGVDAALLPGEQMSADANRGWTLAEALRVVRAVRDIDFILEQPCYSYEHCLSVRRRTDIPIMLDEVIDSLPMLLRAINDDAADAINIKIAKVGGLTKARRIRDVCAETGMELGIEDIGGSDVSNAAMAHLAQSTPESIRRPVLEWNTLVDRRTVTAGATIGLGTMSPSDSPGLGIEIRPDCLVEKVFDLGDTRTAT